MSAAVGAALKKIAVALLTDKGVLKSLGMVILVLLVVLLLPLMALVAVLSGNVELDTNALMNRIEANLSDSDRAMLTAIEDTMEAIETALTEAQMPDRVAEAQALYIMALYDKSGGADFVTRLVSCFSEGQTDAQLINAVNTEFGTNITVEEFSHVAQNLRTTYIDYSDYHMWEYNKPEWYTPISLTDKARIADTVMDYAEMYVGQSMTGQGMSM